MKLNRIYFLLMIPVLVLSCSRGYSPEGEQSQATKPAEPAAVSPPEAPSRPSSTASATIAGIEWTVPQGWQMQPARPMRFATYSIPAASGDPEGGECAVFFFGSGQGGDVRANIDRWVAQFETESKPEEATKTVGDVKVTTVQLEGTYLAPGGPMMQSQGKKENYRLLGAIVEAPEGAVFFKTTGPAATVSGASADIDSLINSIRKIS